MTICKAYDISESFLRKSLAQESFARKLAQVTCESSTWHTCKANNQSCRLKVTFRGRYTVLWFWQTDWPIRAHRLRQKTFRNRSSYFWKFTFASKNLRHCVCHIWKFSCESGFRDKM